LKNLKNIPEFFYIFDRGDFPCSNNNFNAQSSRSDLCDPGPKYQIKPQEKEIFEDCCQNPFLRTLPLPALWPSVCRSFAAALLPSVILEHGRGTFPPVRGQNGLLAELHRCFLTEYRSLILNQRESEVEMTSVGHIPMYHRMIRGKNDGNIWGSRPHAPVSDEPPPPPKGRPRGGSMAG
jgi:hypothetical protein